MLIFSLVLALACNGGKDDTDSGTGDGGGGGDGGGLPWDGGGGDGGSDGGTTTVVDNDDDGSPFGEDCDDTDPEVYPGATEICNGKDDDCDPSTNEADWIEADGMQWGSLQEAIDGVTEGEAVKVCSGIYAERLMIDRNILVFSTLGSEYTFLDATGMDGTALTVTGGIVTFSGFTVMGGTGGDHRGEGNLLGGGVYVSTPAQLQLSDVNLSGNSADEGGGLFADEGVVLDLVSSFVTDNRATFGAGLSGIEAEIRMGSTEISGNEATEHGGGMAGREVVFQISSGAVLENIAALGGGASTVQDSTLVVLGCDWGDAGDSDNMPEDVWTSGGSYTEYGVSSSFTCNAGGCE